MIVDAHAHVFPQVRSALGRVEAFEPGRFDPETLLGAMDAAGVDRAVLLQGPFYGDWTEYAVEALHRHPGRLAGLAYLDPWAPEARSLYDRRVESGVFLGVKLECSARTGLLGLHPRARLDDDSLGWLWKDLERRRLSLTLDLGAPGTASYQTEAVDGIARRHSGLRIVVAHLAQPSARVLREPEAWRGQVDLAKHPNVWLDTAALPHKWPEESYPWPGAAAALREATDRVGPGRILWGTDVPGLLSAGAYTELRSWVELALSHLRPAEIAGVMGTNALRAYGLEP